MRLHSRAARAIAALCGLLLAMAGAPAWAGPGHDHGPDGGHGDTAATASAPAKPRFTAVSEHYELVGILGVDGALTVYLDRLVDTAPVTAATLEFLIDGESFRAEPTQDGLYALKAPALATPGEREIIVTIAEDGRSDLLIGALSGGAAGAHHDHGHGAHVHEEGGHAHQSDGSLGAFFSGGLAGASAISIVSLVLGLAIGFALRGKRKGETVASIALVAGLAAMAAPGASHAGPGHEHGPDGGHGGAGAVIAIQGEAPRRLPTGEMFLPKPTQRLLDIRTRVLKPQPVRPSIRLTGQIIADPNRSGLVQSTIKGRIVAPPAGFPVLGRTIRKGQVLALVEPALTAGEQTDLGQTAGDLEQRIAVLEAQISRQEKLGVQRLATGAVLEDLKIERRGLIERRKSLKDALRASEILTAPAEGVVAEMSVAAGQVVSPGVTLFRIYDAKSLLVEAVDYDGHALEGAEGAHAWATTHQGRRLELSFLGRSRALRHHAAVLHFRINDAGENLLLGEPLRVRVRTAAEKTGLVAPRSAVAQGPTGEWTVFKRLAPELYQPVAVRIEDLGDGDVLILAGLSAGDQIVVQGAPLVNQIR